MAAAAGREVRISAAELKDFDSSALSLLLGLGLGLLSSRLIWRTLSGTAAPAELIRRLLALPRSIHELLWGLLLGPLWLALAALVIVGGVMLTRL